MAESRSKAVGVERFQKLSKLLTDLNFHTKSSKQEFNPLYYALLAHKTADKDNVQKKVQEAALELGKLKYNQIKEKEKITTESHAKIVFLIRISLFKADLVFLRDLIEDFSSDPAIKKSLDELKVLLTSQLIQLKKESYDDSALKIKLDELSKLMNEAIALSVLHQTSQQAASVKEKDHSEPSRLEEEKLEIQPKATENQTNSNTKEANTKEANTKEVKRSVSFDENSNLFPTKKRMLQHYEKNENKDPTYTTSPKMDPTVPVFRN